MAYTEKQLLFRRLSAMRTERATWWSHWQDLSTHILPRSGRFFVQDRNRGNRRHNSIYDNTGTKALRVLAAGLMSGMTSPARPWFRLGTPDRELAKYGPVKAWLNEVTTIMLDVFARSNTYRAFHSMYEELGVFGTASSLVVTNFNHVIWHHPMTVGEYMISTDWQGNVTSLFREFQKTVVEVVTEFGRENCSDTVKTLYDKGQLDSWVTIVQAIEPRSFRDVSKQDAKNMPWKSCYFELGADNEKFLRESGFKSYPCLSPRWATSGGDIYGNSPAMDALGDIKQLQHEQKRKGQGIDFMTNPPLQAPTSMKNREQGLLPGEISYVDMTGPNNAIKTAFDVRLDLSHLLADIQDVRERIRGAFFYDVFLMIANSGPDTRMTATEVAERHEEKMIMLGPVLERLHNEMLSPKIELTFNACLEAGILPPPPREMAGKDLDVELISILAQAQRAIGVNSVDRLVGNIGAVAGFKPEVLDNFNADKWITLYSESLGVDPEILNSEEDVAATREARAQQQSAMQQAAMMNQGADTAQKLAQAQTDKPSALTDVTQAFAGYT